MGLCAMHVKYRAGGPARLIPGPGYLGRVHGSDKEATRRPEKPEWASRPILVGSSWAVDTNQL